MQIGIVYDLFEDYPWLDGEPGDADSENEPLETLTALEDAIRLLGHRPLRLGSPWGLAERLKAAHVDLVVNISEAAHSRNREAYAPIILEMAGVPCLGSDALSLSVSLDKAWTKDLIMAAGVATPPYRTYSGMEEIDEHDLPAPFPLFVKPRYEGSSKGISRHSRVFSVEELSRQVNWCTATYQQDALVEKFISGSEFTVVVIGSYPVRALPAMQRAVDAESEIGVHALDRRGQRDDSISYCLPGDLSTELDETLKKLSLAAFHKLDCLDFARVDFRVDKDGKAWFLEINPLPTFAPDGTLAILAELENRSYTEMLSDILQEAIQRVAGVTV